jgi:hypothetical protein
MFSFHLGKGITQELGAQGINPVRRRKLFLFLLQAIDLRGMIQVGQRVERRALTDRRKPIPPMAPDRQNAGDRRKRDRRRGEERRELQDERAEVHSMKVHVTEERREEWQGRRAGDRFEQR